MRFYLSSYKIGDTPDRLRALAQGKRIGYVPNALDFVEPEARAVSNTKDMGSLTELGIIVEELDLASYFDDQDALERKLTDLDGVWVRGGNTFVVRSAMRRSGFDTLIHHMDRDEFLYSGYSAGICVLAPDLGPLRFVDDPTIDPYGGMTAPIEEGLGLLPFLILPHYRSEHPESAAIDACVAFCEAHGIAYRTLRDGETISL
jgi:dipeptidase E